jgi:hypothetical protein
MVPPVCDRIRPTSVYFVGTLIEDKEEFRYHDPFIRSTSHLLRLRVTEAFVGAEAGQIVTVFTKRKTAPVGREIFIPAGRGANGEVFFSEEGCGYPDTEEMLAYLRKWKRGPKDPPSLSILTRTDTGSDSKGAVVTISGPVTRSASVGNDGHAIFPGIPSGRYTIDVYFPGYEKSSVPQTVEVWPNSCASDFVQLRLKPTPNVSKSRPSKGIY